MLSLEQRKTVLQEIPNSFVVDNVQFTVSKFYANQFTRAQFPSIVLDYQISEDKEKGPLNYKVSTTKLDANNLSYVHGIETVDVLTINVYTADGKTQNVNSIRVVDSITREVRKFFLHTFDHPDIVVRDMSSVSALDENEGSFWVRRRVFDVFLAHIDTTSSTVARIKDVNYSVGV